MHPDRQVLGDAGDDGGAEVRQVRHVVGDAIGALLVADQELGAGVRQSVVELLTGPPGVEGHDHGTRGRRRPEGDGPLRKVAHSDRHPVAVLHAKAIAPYPRQVGRGAEVLLEGDPLVLVDEEGGVTVRAARRQDVPEGGGGVLPHRGPHPADLDLDDLEHLIGGCQLLIGFGDRHRHAISSSFQEVRRSRTWTGVSLRVSGRTASTIRRCSQ